MPFLYKKVSSLLFLTHTFLIALPTFVEAMEDQEKVGNVEKKAIPNPPLSTHNETFLKEYFENQGRQKYQLTDPRFLMKEGGMRWVEDMAHLDVSYGSKRHALGEAIPIPFILNHSPSLAFDELGIALKIMNGYQNGYDENNGNLTPDKTNFLIPYVSFLVQWNPGEKPVFIPGGYLSFHKKKEAAAVFVSGKGEKLDKFASFYNAVLRKKEGPAIELIAGEEIKSLRIIRYLQKNGENLLILKNPLSVLEEFMKKITARKGPQNDEEKANNAISFAGQLLYFIFSNKYEEVIKICNNTLKILKSCYNTEEYKDNNSLKIKLQEDMKDPLKKKEIFELAVRRMKVESGKLQANSYDEIKKYIKLFELFISENIKKSKGAKEFYNQLKELSQQINSKVWAFKNKIDEEGGPTDKHTEYWLVEVLTHKPNALVRTLSKALANNSRASSKPQIKLITIDMHSWLDMCHKHYGGCQQVLFNFKEKEWKSALASFSQQLPSCFRKTKKSGESKFPHSLFRIYSEQQYQENFSNLKGAGGGQDLLKEGFNVKVISNLRLTLAARRPLNETRPRDSSIENIWHRIGHVCMWQPKEFWYDNVAAWETLINLSVKRPIVMNNLILLNKLHGQEDVAFPLALAHQLNKIEENQEEMLPEKLWYEMENVLAKWNQEKVTSLSQNTSKLLEFAYNRRYYLKEFPSAYINLYLGEVYLKLANLFLEKNESGEEQKGAITSLRKWSEGLKFEYNWSNRSLQEIPYNYAPSDPGLKDPTRATYERILQYAETRRLDLKNEEYGSPQKIENLISLRH